MLLHATTVDIAGLGVIIFGEPGAGKSDLALRLVAAGGLLVADDQSDVDVQGASLRACAPAATAGLIEVRAIGVVLTPRKHATLLRLAVTLSAAIPERMPEPRFWSLPGHAKPQIPSIALQPFEISACEKVRHALIQPNGAVPKA